MRNHNNDTMSLAVYLVVEKPNKYVQRTLALMHMEEPIVCIKKPTLATNIEVWSRKGRQDSADGKQHDIYSVSMIDTMKGGILGSREERQLVSQDIVSFK